MCLTRTALALLLMSLCMTSALAQDSSAPITVEADQLEIDQKSGISIYQGNVRLQQQTLLLLAERLELRSEQGEISRVYAEGSPVHLEHKDPQTGSLTRADASRMEYRLGEGILELKGDARLWREGEEFSGTHLIYESETQVVRAFGDPQGEESGRVRMILQPNRGGNDE